MGRGSLQCVEATKQVLQVRVGMRGSRNRLAGKACCSLCHQWASRVGEQTCQNQVKLLQSRGEAAHPNFSVSGKKGIALVQQYFSISFLCLSGINRESSGCSFSKFYCILGPTPFSERPGVGWPTFCAVPWVIIKEAGVSAVQGLDSRLRKLGPVVLGQ